MVNPQHANYAFTRQFIDTYLMTDGTPFTSKYPITTTPGPRGRVHGSGDYRLGTDDPRRGFFTRDGGTTQGS